MKRPYEFTGPYSDCYSNRDMAIDERHVFIMHDVLRRFRFGSALELGSFCGASSTAFVEAINHGRDMRATFCDIRLTDSLWSVVGNCKKPEQVRVTKESSVAVLESGNIYDFIFVDACHDMASVGEELRRLVERKPFCLMAHDTSATDNGYPEAEGARLLRDVFKNMPGYQCVEDNLRRPGEQTHRGLFLASSHPEIFAIAGEAFERWAPQPYSENS